ncbi:uncharacterized protein STEHIDRAFT_143897 [Stereum hirsutum FP-91666 SS1]|uniref:uncharacterized protein n=1 Tax=Stereum hirsutum (strain FP-91666) TaxID=721885 RepID=UPI000440F7FE|nr:uncharacterized protein STEHIDRAFT_143897 [Stereum hirsutum FP-91666 SS1]EIM92563.1 hypothetical protein STEHIDRAFT_143897 [Stereum hirsutum FP-91666 SS1]
MPPKRKSDALDDADDAAVAPAVAPAKRTRVSKKKVNVDADADADGDDDYADDVPEASTSKGKKKAKVQEAPKDYKDIKLDGEDEGEVPIYDDCNEVRRKIRLLQKEPGFKVTHWLKEIGGVNSNSYGRFMKATGPTGGAENSTYYGAYVYFEKRRIAEGKKKTAKRERNEIEHPGGMPREDRGRRGYWVFTGVPGRR